MATGKERVRVVVTLENDSVKIEVNNLPMRDIDVLQKTPISQWFEKIPGRSGWRGLLQQIAHKLCYSNDQESFESFLRDKQLCFEFNGREEDRALFNAELEKRGIDPDDSFSNEEKYAKAMHAADIAHKQGQLDEELRNYIIAADSANSAEAKYLVAEIYYDAYSEKIDISGLSKEDALEKAIKYYNCAVEQGCSEAAWKLYQIYDKEILNGLTGRAIAWKYLNMAVELNHIEAQYIWGTKYLNSKFKSCSCKAEWLLRTAASKGHAKASCLLGKYYLDTSRFSKAEAYSWFVKAASLGDAEAMYNLWNMLSEGNEEIEQNVTNAVSFLQKSCEQKYAEALYTLGIMHLTGNYVKADTDLAMTYLSDAAEQGHCLAQYELARFLACGLDFSNNFEKICSLYEKASSQGHIEAQSETDELNKFKHAVFKFKEFLKSVIYELNGIGQEYYLEEDRKVKNISLDEFNKMSILDWDSKEFYNFHSKFLRTFRVRLLTLFLMEYIQHYEKIILNRFAHHCEEKTLIFKQVDSYRLSLDDDTRRFIKEFLSSDSYRNIFMKMNHNCSYIQNNKANPVELNKAIFEINQTVKNGLDKNSKNEVLSNEKVIRLLFQLTYMISTGCVWRDDLVRTDIFKSTKSDKEVKILFEALGAAIEKKCKYNERPLLYLAFNKARPSIFSGYDDINDNKNLSVGLRAMHYTEFFCNDKNVSRFLKKILR